MKINRLGYQAAISFVCFHSVRVLVVCAEEDVGDKEVEEVCERERVHAELVRDLSFLGVPVMSRGQSMTTVLRLFRPTFVRAACPCVHRNILMLHAIDQ